MKRTAFTILLCAVWISADCDTYSDKVSAYVEKFGTSAVDEMKRSGVPASITLAQGILESSCGESRLAREANNHFGIKCSSDWEGKRIYHNDDRKGECFRKYSSASESFRDHSDFLKGRQRYSFLFDYNMTDYKSWSYGLSKAGYATDPSYASKLIKIIENYDLSRFDAEVKTKKAVVATDKKQKHQKQVKDTGIPVKDGVVTVSLVREIHSNNGIPFIYAREGETYSSISAIYGLFPKELAAFNDEQNQYRDLKAGEVVYIHRKAVKAEKRFDSYVCRGDENIREISQKFAVRLKSLMKYNGLNNPDHETKAGEEILLRKQ